MISIGEVDRSILRGSGNDLRAMWGTLTLADILYKLLALGLVAPAVGVCFRMFLAFSGRELLADEDILWFLLTPWGVVTLIVVGAMSLGTLAMEQATLLAMVFGRERGEGIGVRQALFFTATRAIAILRLAGRLIGLTLLTAAPFVLLAGVAYQSLLTEYDINYYLHEHPPSFLLAVGVGLLLILGFAALWIPLLAAWSMTLPLILLENVPVAVALRTSRQRTAGHRLRITVWLAAWAMGNTLLSVAGSALLVWLSQTFVTASLGSLQLIVFAVGCILALWLVINLATTLLATISFAVLLTHLYRRLCMGSEARLPVAAIRDLRQRQQASTITRGRIVAASLILLLVAAGLGVWLLLDSLRFDDHTAIMAHRGASATAPENTLAAVEQAIDDGADWVEIDVQESSDGEVMVVHDSDLKKIGRSNLKVWQATAAELRQVDIGSWFSPAFSDQRVPTLDEVLQRCKGRIRVNIELKYYGHDQQLEQRVSQRVEAYGMGPEVVIMSLKKSGIDKFKRLQPDWPAGLLTATAVGDLSRVKVDFLAVNTQLATRPFIRAARRRGKRVFVWTVNDPITMSTMMGRGVDAIITDKPALAKAVREQRRNMNAVQRLLLQVAAVIGSTPDIELSLDDV